MAYIVMAYIVMAYIVIAYIVMACIVMAHIVMAYLWPICPMRARDERGLTNRSCNRHLAALAPSIHTVDPHVQSTPLVHTVNPHR